LLKCSAGRFVAIRSRGFVNLAERFVFVAFVRFRSLDKIKIITIKKINQAFFYVFFRFFVFSLFSAGLRASFSPFAFFVFPIVKAQKKPFFFRFCPIPPISPQKKDFLLYIYFFSRIYIVIYWGKRGNREKSQCFRGFAAFLLLGEN
jgi:hypothetical protein